MVEVEEEDEEGVVGVAVGKINQLVNVATLFSFVFGSFLVSHLQLARRRAVDAVLFSYPLHLHLEGALPAVPPPLRPDRRFVEVLQAGDEGRQVQQSAVECFKSWSSGARNAGQFMHTHVVCANPQRCERPTRPSADSLSPDARCHEDDREHDDEKDVDVHLRVFLLKNAKPRTDSGDGNALPEIRLEISF